MKRFVTMNKSLGITISKSQPHFSLWVSGDNQSLHNRFQILIKLLQNQFVLFTSKILKNVIGNICMYYKTYHNSIELDWVKICNLIFYGLSTTVSLHKTRGSNQMKNGSLFIHVLTLLLNLSIVRLNVLLYWNKSF